jgi:hemerythrin-like domain-containing protein
MNKRPTDTLEDEHGVILKVVGTMPVLAESLEIGASVAPDVLRDIAEFMGVFADKCHHGKEEAHLFPALERKGVPLRGCPVGALTAEHQAGRVLVRAFTEAAEAYISQGASAKGPLIESLKKLTGLYPGHIWKEDYLLFPMTNKVLGPTEQQELAAKFEAVEEEMGKDVHHRLEQVAATLQERCVSVMPE